MNLSDDYEFEVIFKGRILGRASVDSRHMFLQKHLTVEESQSRNPGDVEFKLVKKEIKE